MRFSRRYKCVFYHNSSIITARQQRVNGNVGVVCFSKSKQVLQVLHHTVAGTGLLATAGAAVSLT